MREKNELLDEVKLVVAPDKELGFSYYIYIIFLIAFLGMLIFPKIYIEQQIYFKSRNIAKLKVEYDTLKSENRRIRASVEKIKFKNQILDTLF